MHRSRFRKGVTQSTVWHMLRFEIRFASWVPVYLALVYLVRELRRSAALKSRLIPNENVFSLKGTLRL